MTSYLNLDKLLGEIRSKSTNGMEFSCYALANYYGGYEVHCTWPDGAMISFMVSEPALLNPKTLKEVLFPYINKIEEHEKLLSSPLMKVLR